MTPNEIATNVSGIVPDGNIEATASFSTPPFSRQFVTDDVR